MTPPAWRRSKIIGICLNVEALPMPAKRKIASMPHRNRSKPASRVAAEVVSGTRAVMVKPIEAIRPIPEMSVQIAPPILSVSGENSTRAPAPTSGPRKTNLTASGTS